MNRNALGLAAALVSGIVFGIGLALARMIDPEKIKDFLDVAAIPSGGWDPSLAFVMGGGVLVFLVGFRIDRLLRRPVAAPAFVRPDKTRLDGPLIGGAVLFGAGWGIAGFCPGPAIVDLGLAPGGVILFVAAMLLGSWIAGLTTEAVAQRPLRVAVDAKAA